MVQPSDYVVLPGQWKLVWRCTFCLATHLWEPGVPHDDEVRTSRLQVARAVANHLHCSPGCGRYISSGAVAWEWQADE